MLHTATGCAAPPRPPVGAPSRGSLVCRRRGTRPPQRLQARNAAPRSSTPSTAATSTTRAPATPRPASRAAPRPSPSSERSGGARPGPSGCLVPGRLLVRACTGQVAAVGWPAVWAQPWRKLRPGLSPVTSAPPSPASQVRQAVLLLRLQGRGADAPEQWLRSGQRNPGPVQHG